MNKRFPQDAQHAVAAVTDALGLESPQVTALPAGIANRALRLRDARHDLVLRISGRASAALGASRDSECAMQALAAGADLAPAVVLAWPEQGLLVTQFVRGRPLSRAEMRNPGVTTRVGAWIARLHALPPPQLPSVDFGARAAACLAAAQVRSPSAESAELARRLAARRAMLAPARPVACHHDLHHRNFIDDAGRLRVVDWEYAGPGDPAADLAACIGYHDLGPAEIDALLAGYGTEDAPLRARLATLGWIFDCLWYGWIATAAIEGLAPEPGRQERLAARLLA
ncbi:MAG TPA: choline/ethanolamine kinase family protein [Steroidobacteraceae bacterium]|nr:choline/ethanolamine kinase family protein [Steroidobacteraceae bacterium]